MEFSVIAIKTASFKAVKEFKPESEAELQQLEISFAKITTLTCQIILFCFCYGPPNEDPSWINVFVIIFQFNAFIKAPPKTLRFVYDYAKGDFEGLRTALSAIILSSIIADDDTNNGRHQ